jgi:YcxB-like protein
MQINFQLSFEDYLASMSLHSTRGTWSRINYMLNLYFAPVVGLFAFALAWMLKRGASSYDFILILCGLFMFVYPIYLRWKLRSCYRRTRTGTGDCTLTLDSQRVLIDAGNVKSEMEWSAIRAVRENERLFMLYLAPAKFVAIPKRACSVEQIDEIRTMLSQRVRTVSS